MEGLNQVGFESWRGTVGVIKPTKRPGGLEEFIRLLPDGIGVVPVTLDVKGGTDDEFAHVLSAYEQSIAELVEAEVDLVHAEGAPPFIRVGFDAERMLVSEWERRYEVSVVTAPMTQVDAMRALCMRRIVGVTYFQGVVNENAERYFTDAGFEVLSVKGMDVPFERVGQLSSHEIYTHAKRTFLAEKDVDGIYMLGAGWRCLDIIDLLEQDLDTTVVHPNVARAWAIERRLHVRQKTDGLGRLLSEFPPLP